MAEVGRSSATTSWPSTFDAVRGLSDLKVRTVFSASCHVYTLIMEKVYTWPVPMTAVVISATGIPKKDASPAWYRVSLNSEIEEDISTTMLTL